MEHSSGTFELKMTSIILYAHYQLFIIIDAQYPLSIILDAHYPTQAPALQGEGGSCPRRRWLPACAEERPGAGDISRFEIKV